MRGEGVMGGGNGGRTDIDCSSCDPRAHKNGWLEQECVTPIVWSKLLNCTTNRTLGYVLSNNALCLPSMCICVTIL